VVGLHRSATRLRLAGVGPTRPNELCSNKVLDVERRKAVGNLLRRLALVADELEHGTIAIFHETTVLLAAKRVLVDTVRSNCPEIVSPTVRVVQVSEVITVEPV